MKFKEFLAKKPLTRDDLFGEWKQKGTDDIDNPKSGIAAAEKLTWMRIRVKRAIKTKELTIPESADCTFMRGKVPHAKIGETMAVRSGSDLLYTIVAGGGEFIVNRGKSTDVRTEKKDCRKGKSRNSEKENRTPAEIQDATPIELRTGWTNYALLDTLNEKACNETVAYWNSHDEKFPKRKYRKATKN